MCVPVRLCLPMNNKMRIYAIFLLISHRLIGINWPLVVMGFWNLINSKPWVASVAALNLDELHVEHHICQHDPDDESAPRAPGFPASISLEFGEVLPAGQSLQIDFKTPENDLEFSLVLANALLL